MEATKLQDNNAKRSDQSAYTQEPGPLTVSSSTLPTTLLAPGSATEHWKKNNPKTFWIYMWNRDVDLKRGKTFRKLMLQALQPQHPPRAPHTRQAHEMSCPVLLLVSWLQGRERGCKRQVARCHNHCLPFPNRRINNASPHHDFVPATFAPPGLRQAQPGPAAGCACLSTESPEPRLGRAGQGIHATLPGGHKPACPRLQGKRILRTPLPKDPAPASPTPPRPPGSPQHGRRGRGAAGSSSQHAPRGSRAAWRPPAGRGGEDAADAAGRGGGSTAGRAGWGGGGGGGGSRSSGRRSGERCGTARRGPGRTAGAPSPPSC